MKLATSKAEVPPSIHLRKVVFRGSLYFILLVGLMIACLPQGAFAQQGTYTGWSWCGRSGHPYVKGNCPICARNNTSSSSGSSSSGGSSAGTQLGEMIGTKIGKFLFGNPAEESRQQAAEQEQVLAQQRAAAAAAEKERAAKAEAARREAIRLAAVRDKQDGLHAFKEKNWEQAIAHLSSALTGLPNDTEIQDKLKLARNKLAKEIENHQRNQKAFNPYATVTPNSGLSIPVQRDRQIRNINAQSPYKPPSLQLPTQPIKQSQTASGQPKSGIWQRDVPVEERASRTVILEEKNVGNPNLPGLALNDGKKGYGIAGLPGIYTDGPGSSSGMTPQNEPKLKTEIGDSIGANHVGNPNLPGIGLNDGKQGYGIPGLPGAYTGGSASGSGTTPQGDPELKLKIGESGSPPLASVNGTPNPRTTDANNMTSKQASVATQPALVLPASPAQGPNGGVRAAPTPGLSPTLTPQTAAQPIATLQQQANVAQAAAPVLEEASSKARAGFDTRARQPAIVTISGGTATPVPNTKAVGQLVSAAASNQNSRNNFDTGGRYAGAPPTPIGGGTGFSDSSVVDLRAKQGTVDPSVLKGKPSDPIVPRGASNGTGTSPSMRPQGSAPDFPASWGTLEQVHDMLSPKMPASEPDAWLYIGRAARFIGENTWDRTQPTVGKAFEAQFGILGVVFINEYKLPSLILPKIIAAAEGSMTVEEANLLPLSTAHHLFNAGSLPDELLGKIIAKGDSKTGVISFGVEKGIGMATEEASKAIGKFITTEVATFYADQKYPVGRSLFDRIMNPATKKELTGELRTDAQAIIEAGKIAKGADKAIWTDEPTGEKVP